jgi:hypothetical protein
MYSIMTGVPSADFAVYAVIGHYVFHQVFVAIM